MNSSMDVAVRAISHQVSDFSAVKPELLHDAVIDARDMCSMNFAREEFDKLERILWPLIEPLLCQQQTGPASDIARHLEQIRIFSGNFCYRHRHLGASHGVVGSRAETGEGGRNE